MSERCGYLVMIGLLACSVVGCAERRVEAPTDHAKSQGEQTSATQVIEVHGPMAVGFFPIVTQAGVDADDEVRSALEHFGCAIEDMTKCLRPKGIPVQAVQAEAVIFNDGDRRRQLSLWKISNESVGCYLIEPGRDPKIVRATAGPSSLVVLCPAAASMYFDIPECCPQGFRCCPDGSVVDEAYPCDG
jgi:hypothetical protein